MSNKPEYYNSERINACVPFLKHYTCICLFKKLGRGFGHKAKLASYPKPLPIQLLALQYRIKVVRCLTVLQAMKSLVGSGNEPICCIFCYARNVGCIHACYHRQHVCSNVDIEIAAA